MDGGERKGRGRLVVASEPRMTKNRLKGAPGNPKSVRNGPETAMPAIAKQAKDRKSDAVAFPVLRAVRRRGRSSD